MARRIKTQDDYYLASQWQLMLRKLKNHIHLMKYV